MAEEETFILVSLDEQKSKELAQVISNDTSRKILDYLGKSEATESELSKNLNMPLSTVHYNVQQLLKAGLVESKEFIYSDKGKEVNIYTVAKKLIVITPTKQSNVKEILKNLIPITLISLGAAFVIQIVSSNFSKNLISDAKTTITQQAETSAEAGVAATIPTMAQNILTPNYGLWFFFGALFVIIVYFFYIILKKRKK
ncbi:helix-turn-helix domain-containing protein [Candidatus Woesearchaeota archaeon]|nr:helix-turn-helix domain-containing protein [Candidatus Woesearchaeota archaeon]